jgi:hypothetical protein
MHLTERLDILKINTLYSEEKNIGLEFGLLGIIVLAILLNFMNFVVNSFRDLSAMLKKWGESVRKFFKNLTQPR